MPVQDYYFSRKAVPRFGKLYFLKVLQEAGSEGGESEKDFDADFEAKLKAFNSIPGIGAKVAYAIQAKRKILVKVSGNEHYLVALGVSAWGDFDLT